jgi:photosystem II stability/assembly factor-like uncharacterized protein
MTAALHPLLLRCAPAVLAAAMAAPAPAPAPLPAPVMFHSPHDVIDGWAISPNYGKDKTLFLSLSRFNLLLRTRDGGKTFESVGGGLDNQHVQWLAISSDFANDRTLWCAETRGLFRSQDGGDFWLKIPSPPELRDATGMACSPAFAEDGTLLAGTRGNGLWISRDRGETWSLAWAPEGAKKGRAGPIQPAVFASDFAQSGILAAISGGSQLLLSEDSGETFAALPLPVDGVQALALSEDFASSGRLWIGSRSDGVWRSEDRGASFEPEEATAGMNVLHLARASDSAGGVLFASTAVEGVLHKPDGGEWFLEPSGMRGQTHQTTLHYTGAIPSPRFAKDHTVFAATFEGLHVSRDGGSTWQWLNVLHAYIVRNLALSENFATDRTLWLSTYGAGLLMSTDAGKTFRTLDTKSWMFPDGIAASPAFAKDRTLLIGIPNHLLVSTDGGRTSSEPGIADSRGFVRYVAFAPDYAQSGIAFAFFNNEDTSKDRFMVTRSRGVAWADTNITSVFDLAFASDWRSSGRVWAATPQGLMRSSDRGQSFERAESLDVLGLSSVSLARGTKGDVLMACSLAMGVHYSPDGGETWTLLALGVPPVRPNRVRLSPDFAHDGTAFAGPSNAAPFVTRNGGRTWSSMDGGPSGAMSMEISPTFEADHTLVVGSYEGPWITADAGVTWSRIVYPVPVEPATTREGVSPREPTGDDAAAPR